MVMIRDYQDSDYEEVRQNLLNGGLFYELSDTRDNLRRKSERDPESIIVAEYDHAVVGNVFFVEDGWMPWIFRLAVRKEYRERGIGSLLMDEAEKRLKARGYQLIGFFVNEQEPEAQEWYTKRGSFSGGRYRFMGKKL